MLGLARSFLFNAITLLFPVIAPCNSSFTDEKQETTETGRWGPMEPKGNSNGDDGAGAGDASGTSGRKRKTRWADEEPKSLIQLPNFMGRIEFDPKVQALNSRLLEISPGCRWMIGRRARSPSPKPIYDNLGSSSKLAGILKDPQKPTVGGKSVSPEGLRLDRRPIEMRPLRAEIGVVPKADGLGSV